VIGLTISHYRVLQELGVGGMGGIYEAEDTTLGRRVALKFLTPELISDIAALERFQREARASLALNCCQNLFGKVIGILLLAAGPSAEKSIPGIRNPVQSSEVSYNTSSQYRSLLPSCVRQTTVRPQV
jgi:serine/threonine protein kinase